LLHVFQRDAAQCEHCHLYCVRGIIEQPDPQRRAIGGFGRCEKYRAEYGKIAALRFRSPDFLHGVARNTDEKARGRDLPQARWSD